MGMLTVSLNSPLLFPCYTSMTCHDSRTDLACPPFSSLYVIYLFMTCMHGTHVILHSLCMTYSFINVTPLETRERKYYFFHTGDGGVQVKVLYFDL